MASTITAATMTVTISESITLNGKNKGGTQTLSISSVNEILNHIVPCTTDKNEVLGFIASGTAKGSFLEANVRYMRFTNLDTANHVVLFFTNESNDEVAIKLDYGQSFIWNGDLSGGVVDTMDANSAGTASSGQLADITKVSIQADTDTVDVQIFVASV